MQQRICQEGMMIKDGSGNHPDIGRVACHTALGVSTIKNVLVSCTVVAVMKESHQNFFDRAQAKPPLTSSL